MQSEEEKRRTIEGNPRKPEGEAGEEMLLRMNESHSGVTGWAFDFLKLKESDNVLDIGCGGGAALKRMSEKIVSGHLTGVDYSQTSVKMSAATNRKDVESGKTDIIEASVDSLPFEDNSFDKITTVESFYFWPQPAENLKEVRRVLKKGGAFLLIADIYNREGLEEETVENIKRYNLFNPTPEEFKEMFAQAGFSHTTVHTKEGTDWICVEGIK